MVAEPCRNLAGHHDRLAAALVDVLGAQVAGVEKEHEGGTHAEADEDDCSGGNRPRAFVGLFRSGGDADHSAVRPHA